MSDMKMGGLKHVILQRIQTNTKSMETIQNSSRHQERTITDFSINKILATDNHHNSNSAINRHQHIKMADNMESPSSSTSSTAAICNNFGILDLSRNCVKIVNNQLQNPNKITNSIYGNYLLAAKHCDYDLAIPNLPDSLKQSDLLVRPKVYKLYHPNNYGSVHSSDFFYSNNYNNRYVCGYNGNNNLNNDYWLNPDQNKHYRSVETVNLLPTASTTKTTTTTTKTTINYDPKRMYGIVSELIESNENDDKTNEEISFKCEICEKVFGNAISLQSHSKTHKSSRYGCAECGKGFSQLRNFKYHLSVHRGTKEFAAECQECGKIFNDKGYLSSHMKIHRNKKEYECPYCPKSFNQRVAFNMHVRIHTGVKPHKCPECGKRFSRKMLLKQHMRTHSGEKPYQCCVCGKSFADRSNMTLHHRLHSGIKPFTCPICPKAFTKKHHLKTHLNYHTGCKPYVCPHSSCNQAFTQSSNMRTHAKKCPFKPITTTNGGAVNDIVSYNI